MRSRHKLHAREGYFEDLEEMLVVLKRWTHQSHTQKVEMSLGASSFFKTRIGSPRS